MGLPSRHGIHAGRKRADAGRRRTWRGVLACGVAAGAGLFSLAVVASPASAAPASGTVQTGGTALHVRSGPSLSSSILGSLADGTPVTITCQTTGDTVNGNWGQTNVWDQIGYQAVSGYGYGYVTDGFVFTGSNGQVASSCAYNHSGAANYADAWATNRNPNYVSFGDDCTNFVSQAMFNGGGHPGWGSVVPGVVHDDTQWWAAGPFVGQIGAYRTFSWSVADDLYQFLNNTDTGAWFGESQFPGSQGAYTPPDIIAGDPVFYHWNINSTIDFGQDHVAIDVGVGYDSIYGWYGSLVDEHTNDKRHVIWNLIPENSQWAATTQITEIHIF